MKRFIIRSCASLALSLVLMFGLASPVWAAAATTCPGGSTSKGQVLAGIGETGATDCSGSAITNLASTVVSILSLIIGIAGVIMVMIAGFKYITSGGDSNSVSSAKTTLIYALVGLAIAALAEFLVHFVINKAS